MNNLTIIIEGESTLEKQVAYNLIREAFDLVCAKIGYTLDDSTTYPPSQTEVKIREESYQTFIEEEGIRYIPNVTVNFLIKNYKKVDI